MKKNIAFIFGTRPEAIKLCPLILEMRKSDDLSPYVCVTGQHKEMLSQVLDVFAVRPDVDLAVMQSDQTLASLTARIMLRLSDAFQKISPDLVLVQGDTTTVLSAAISSFYNKIPIAHVEAGLRSGNMSSPFPEEMNRVLTTRIADYHFAPTMQAEQNLLSEGVQKERIFLTGNTVVDALFFAIDQVRKSPPYIQELEPSFFKAVDKGAPIVLITGHRRENFGKGFQDICKAISQLATDFSDMQFVYPVHLNPQVQKPVFQILSHHQNIHLINTLSYLQFVWLMDKSKLILTDSGGVQEEAPSLGKPVLVMRDTTERPEAVNAGTVKLVGTDSDLIVKEATLLLTDRSAYDAMSYAHNPYGDGKACERIISICRKIL